MKILAMSGRLAGLRWPILAGLLLIVELLLANPLAAVAQARRISNLPGQQRNGVTPLNTTRFPQERARLLQPDQRQDFPQMGARFEVLAPSTSAYNCIASSLAIHKYWINPQTGPSDQPLRGMDEIYAAYGFRRLDRLSFQLEPGRRKIVLYGRTRQGTITRITHAANQLPDGTWESKLGKLSRIRHLSPWDLMGPSYGRPVAVYVAP
jgi:hypothetical protein